MKKKQESGGKFFYPSFQESEYNPRLRAALDPGQFWRGCPRKSQFCPGFFFSGSRQSCLDPYTLQKEDKKDASQRTMKKLTSSASMASLLANKTVQIDSTTAPHQALHCFTALHDT
jgi:hypothetical protein